MSFLMEGHVQQVDFFKKVIAMMALRSDIADVDIMQDEVGHCRCGYHRVEVIVLILFRNFSRINLEKPIIVFFFGHFLLR